MEKEKVKPSTDTSFEPTVRNLMSTDLFTLNEDDNIETLEELMKWRRIRHVPIVSLEGQLVGLITHRDFLKIAVSELARITKGEKQKIYRSIPVTEIMGHKVITVEPETSLREAAGLLYQHKIGCLPVVKNEKLVGIITEADFVKAFTLWDAQFNDS